MKDNIIYNAIRTPDGTLLESRHRHDYVTYLDKNGKQYMVDGGHDYLRRNSHSDYEELTVYYSDGHAKVREFLFWGTRGKDGTEPLTYIKLKDMSTEHIRAVMDLSYVDETYHQCFNDEIKWRENELV